MLLFSSCRISLRHQHRQHLLLLHLTILLLLLGFLLLLLPFCYWFTHSSPPHHSYPPTYILVRILSHIICLLFPITSFFTRYFSFCFLLHYHFSNYLSLISLWFVLFLRFHYFSLSSWLPVSLPCFQAVLIFRLHYFSRSNYLSASLACFSISSIL